MYVSERRNTPATCALIGGKFEGKGTEIIRGDQCTRTRGKPANRARILNKFHRDKKITEVSCALLTPTENSMSAYDPRDVLIFDVCTMYKKKLEAKLFLKIFL